VIDLDDVNDLINRIRDLVDSELIDLLGSVEPALEFLDHCDDCDLDDLNRPRDIILIAKLTCPDADEEISEIRNQTLRRCFEDCFEDCIKDCSLDECEILRR